MCSKLQRTTQHLSEPEVGSDSDDDDPNQDLQQSCKLLTWSLSSSTIVATYLSQLPQNSSVSVVFLVNYKYMAYLIKLAVE